MYVQASPCLRLPDPGRCPQVRPDIVENLLCQSPASLGGETGGFVEDPHLGELREELRAARRAVGVEDGMAATRVPRGSTSFCPHRPVDQIPQETLLTP
jgi:hypothetical protein